LITLLFYDWHSPLFLGAYSILYDILYYRSFGRAPYSSILGRNVVVVPSTDRTLTSRGMWVLPPAGMRGVLPPCRRNGDLDSDKREEASSPASNCTGECGVASPIRPRRVPSEPALNKVRVQFTKRA